MTRLSPKPNAGPPQAVRHAPARPYIVIGSAVLAAALLIIVVLNISSAPSKQQQAEETPTDIEVFSPGRLTEEDLATNTNSQTERDPRLSLPSGAGIETSDEDGNLAQRYTFTSLEPDPPGQPAGWVQMQNPVADIYVAKDRVLRLEGESALAYVPKQALESGTMSGNVLIRIYEVTPGERVNPDVDEPSVVVRTPEATFNNIIGEVRCPGHVYVETPDVEFPGDDLTMLINDRDQMIQSLSVQHGEYIRIAGKQVDEATTSRPGNDTNRAPAEPSSAAPQPAPANDNSAEKPSQFYRMTLHENVRIEQGRGEDARKINGDKLSVTFSLKSKGMASAMAFWPLDRDDSPELLGPPSAVAMAMSIPQQIAAAAIALIPDDVRTIAPPPSDDDVMVYWDGPLTMEPITNPKEKLASTSDAMLELFGSPLTLKAEDDWTTVTCAVLAYHTESQNPILRGNEDFPGRIVRADPNQPALQDPARAQGPPVEELRMTWGESLELDFYDTPDGKNSGKLKRATFTKDVEVLSPDLHLRAENMKVGFFAVETERDAIESILATGGVTALRPAATKEEESQLVAKRLLVEFALNAENKSFPKHVRANGDVEARDAAQTMWANVVDVTMRERTEEEQARIEATMAAGDAADNKPGMAGLEWGNENMGSTELETLTAETDVQLLLDGGSRVWADKLQVNGIDRTVELSGDEVLVAHENFLIDKGKYIKLDDLRRNALMQGPGQFRQFDRTVQPTGEGKLPKPVIEDPSMARVRWTDHMAYDEQFDQGNSAIDFFGQVEGSSQPNALESSTVSANRLRLEFERQVKDDAPAADEAEQPNALAGDRRVRRLFAQGDDENKAKIESRSWEKEDHTDIPRVFYIAGDEIDYDEAKLDASVNGAGTLLIRDERPEKADDKPKVVQPGANPIMPSDQESFGSRGTTLFRFTEGMRMVKHADDIYRATFDGNVEWLHKSLDNRTATVTGQHLEAMILRKGKAAENVDLDFGGPAELQRLSGKGGIVINTATRQVMCEEFNYDPSTGVAMLAALPGRTVSVLTQGATQPFQAERVIWYMNEDRISLGNPTMNR